MAWNISYSSPILDIAISPDTIIWSVISGLGSLDLFFFFKQKTAYEMRISDWSSDVCSSDLWLNVLHGQHALGDWRIGWDAAYAKTKSSTYLPIINQTARSEEHTSELQSLMRISYAVFCLKKKNKHKQHMQQSCTEQHKQ